MLRAAGERIRLFALTLDHGLRRIWAAVLTLPLAPWRFTSSATPELGIAPQDLRTADPTVTADIQAGRFAFAGKLVATVNRSAFALAPPSNEWSDTLHGFGWLRHLRASDTQFARATARALVDDWIKRHGRYNATSWRPEVTARRVLSFLAQSPLLLEGADIVFYRRFTRVLIRQVRFLSAIMPTLPRGRIRLTVATALAEAVLCFEGSAVPQRRGHRLLDRELRAQVLPDGGHVSRNPEAVLHLLLDLLPLRQAYAARSVAPPESLLNAIDRMMPMVRYFRHVDGSIALFNGMGPTQADVVATIRAYDDTRGEPAQSAPHSGYQRLEGQGTVMLIDTGRPPPLAVSQEAHAGTLGLELSTGGHRLIVNCGLPAHGRNVWRHLARTSAAHSTLVVADTSSARMLTQSAIGPVILSGPREVKVDRRDDAEGILVTASHDGYARNFDLIHRRTLRLQRDGARIDAEDAILPAYQDRNVANERFALRFHLHPAVKASRVRDGSTVLLVLPDRSAWAFMAPGIEVEIEESVFLAASHGAQRTDQIVIHGRTHVTPIIRWVLARMSREAGERRGSGSELDRLL